MAKHRHIPRLCKICGGPLTARGICTKKHRSGAEAQRGDTVHNLTTGRRGRAVGGMNSGRLLVDLDDGGREPWERWNVVVVDDRV